MTLGAYAAPRADCVRLLLVRHGESVWNKLGFYQGRNDSELSFLGWEQARRLAACLAGVHLDAVYSSPLRRCLDTAREIARSHGLEVAEDVRLVEKSHGIWDGMHKAVVEERYGEMLAGWKKRPHEVVPPGAESLGEVRARALEALAALRSAHVGQVVVLCTHDTVLKVLVCHCLGLGLDRFWALAVDNASLSAVALGKEDARLLHFNITSHLADLAISSAGQAL